MSKTDADIKIGADTTAFTSKMQELSGVVRKGLDGNGKAYMGVLGVMAAGRGVADALSVFTAPAAELENVAPSLGVVMGNAEAAEQLTGSLQRLATNGVVALDDLHRAPAHSGSARPRVAFPPRAARMAATACKSAWRGGRMMPSVRKRAIPTR